MPQYQIQLHPTAKDELDNLPDEEKDKLTDLLKQVSKTREPTAHAKASHLKGQKELFRVRANDARAVCKLDKPNLTVYRVGMRENVYDILDDIEERLAV